MGSQAHVGESAAAGSAAQTGYRAPRDLRQWLEQAEAIGEIKRVRGEVDWDQEMAAITYLYQSRQGAPALLFENIKGYGAETASLWNLIGSSFNRIALALGVSPVLRPLELVRLARDRYSHRMPPVLVPPEAAPVYENHRFGDVVDVLRFPIPRHWPLDGGRYAGTCDLVITRDPESGWLNAATYRIMVHDRNHLGMHVSPGHDARLHIERAWQLGQPIELVACWGISPSWLLVSSQSFPKNQSELDYIGGLMGQPMEMVQGMATALPIPAHAEIAVEGVVRPGATRLEGPFGEFTGYYGRPQGDAFLIEVTGIHHRHRPILTNAFLSDNLANDNGHLYAICRAAKIWADLDRLGVPGIRGVWAHPAAAAGHAMTVIALEQRYAGHAAQVLALAGQCTGGAIFSKWIVAVDHDVDPSDINQVLWAMATRCNPVSDIDILRQTWSTWLDPTQNPPEVRPYSSKALINACMEHRHISRFSPRSRLARSVYERVRARWEELGLEGEPPEVLALEEDR